MVLIMKAIGNWMNRMDMELKHGLMVLNILEILKKDSNRDMGNLFGKRGLPIKENLRIVILMEKEFIFGQIKKFMMGGGNKIKCMVSVCFYVL